MITPEWGRKSANVTKCSLNKTLTLPMNISAWVSQKDFHLQWQLFNYDMSNSHDPTLLRTPPNYICCLYGLTNRYVAEEATYRAFKSNIKFKIYPVCICRVVQSSIVTVKYSDEIILQFCANKLIKNKWHVYKIVNNTSLVLILCKR